MEIKYIYIDSRLKKDKIEQSTAALASLRRTGEEVGLEVFDLKSKVMPINETSAEIKDKVEMFNLSTSSLNCKTNRFHQY